MSNENLQTPDKFLLRWFTQAMERNDLQTIVAYIQKYKLNPNLAVNGKRAIDIAAENGDLDTIKFLLSFGAKLEVEDSERNTCFGFLYAIASCKDLEKRNSLLAYIWEFYPEFRTKEGLTVSHFAAASSELPSERDKDNLLTPDKYGLCPYHYAALSYNFYLFVKKSFVSENYCLSWIPESLSNPLNSIVTMGSIYHGIPLIYFYIEKGAISSINELLAIAKEDERINPNVAPKGENHPLRGVTLMLLMIMEAPVYCQSEKFLGRFSETPNLSASFPASHSNSGISLAYSLAHRKLFELLKKYVNDTIEPFNFVNSVPSNRIYSGKPLCEILIENKEWDLLTIFIQKFPENIFTFLINFGNRLLDAEQWALISTCLNKSPESIPAFEEKCDSLILDKEKFTNLSGGSHKFWNLIPLIIEASAQYKPKSTVKLLARWKKVMLKMALWMEFDALDKLCKYFENPKFQQKIIAIKIKRLFEITIPMLSDYHTSGTEIQDKFKLNLSLLIQLLSNISPILGYEYQMAQEQLGNLILNNLIPCQTLWSYVLEILRSNLSRQATIYDDQLSETAQLKQFAMECYIRAGGFINHNKFSGIYFESVMINQSLKDKIEKLKGKNRFILTMPKLSISVTEENTKENISNNNIVINNDEEMPTPSSNVLNAIESISIEQCLELSEKLIETARWDKLPILLPILMEKIMQDKLSKNREKTLSSPHISAENNPIRDAAFDRMMRKMFPRPDPEFPAKTQTITEFMLYFPEKWEAIILENAPQMDLEVLERFRCLFDKAEFRWKITIIEAKKIHESIASGISQYDQCNTIIQDEIKINLYTLMEMLKKIPESSEIYQEAQNYFGNLMLNQIIPCQALHGVGLNLLGYENLQYMIQKSASTDLLRLKRESILYFMRAKNLHTCFNMYAEVEVENQKLKEEIIILESKDKSIEKFVESYSTPSSPLMFSATTENAQEEKTNNNTVSESLSCETFESHTSSLGRNFF